MNTKQFLQSLYHRCGTRFYPEKIIAIGIKDDTDSISCSFIILIPFFEIVIWLPHVRTIKSLYKQYKCKHKWFYQYKHKICKTCGIMDFN